MEPIRASFKVKETLFYIGRGYARGSLPCKDLLLLAIGRGQGKRKYPVVQTLELLEDIFTTDAAWKF